MSLWRDEKFLRLLAPTLGRFKQKSAHNFNFRCPLCGDSETNQAKARGYIFPKNDLLLYKCHNCSIALPFSALLKRSSRHLYDEYILERLKEDGKRSPEPAPELEPEPVALPVARPFGIHSLVYPLSSLDDQNSVRAYVKNVRKLPDSALGRLFATQMANSWLAPLVGADKAAAVPDGIDYLVQPLRLQDGEWYGAQLRMLTRKEIHTFRWSHAPMKVFGLEAWTPDKLTYIVEGPIDSLFVPNCLATCGSDLLTGFRVLEDLDIIKPSSRRVYVWDNEPRNKEIVHQIETAIKLREHVVIWHREGAKDINDMVRLGIDVNAVLPRRTFFGLNAELEFSAWQRT